MSFLELVPAESQAAGTASRTVCLNRMAATWLWQKGWRCQGDEQPGPCPGMLAPLRPPACLGVRAGSPSSVQLLQKRVVACVRLAEGPGTCWRSRACVFGLCSLPLQEHLSHMSVPRGPAQSSVGHCVHREGLCICLLDFHGQSVAYL